MVRKPSRVKRYAAAVACLAVIVILPGMLAAPRPLPNNAPPETENTPTVLQPKTPVPVPSPSEEDALVFNKADSRISSSDLSVSGLFRQEAVADELDLNEAYADPDFGAYLPRTVPSGFAFESAVRFIDQESDYLSVLWAKGMGNIHWSVSLLVEGDKSRLTSVADTENYDLSLYPIPRAESVPLHLRAIVNNPVFRIEDLTPEAIRARSYTVQDAGDISGPRMRFGVLYGDVLAELNVKGATPEDVFEMLRLLPSRPSQPQQAPES
ncbi:MAG: hypothetical protein GX936_10345 [Clostridiales bacterium]|nr:hypothetical protein [Clostridiales bacterium]